MKKGIEHLLKRAHGGKRKKSSRKSLVGTAASSSGPVTAHG